MARIALALPRALEERVAAEVVRHGDELVARCDNAVGLETVLPLVECAVVAAEPAYLTERLLHAADTAGVRIVALVDGDADRRHALTLGLRETADAASPWPDVQRLLLGAPTPTPAPPAPQPPRGVVIGVWGPAGAPGRTTLAIAISAELAALGHRVALADVDTHSAAVAPAIGLLDEAPGFAAACRLAAVDGLTREELERVAERYSSPSGSFWVLTGIGRPSRWPELSAERVAAVIAACRDWVDFVVLDMSSSLESDEEISTDLFSPRRNAATTAALRAADTVVALGSADPVGLSRFLRSYADLVELTGNDRAIVVMNRVRGSAIGLDPAGQVRQTLERFGGIRDPVLVPFDVAAFDGAVLSGRALADSAPRSPARAAIARLVSDRIVRSEVSRRSRRRARDVTT